MEQTPAPPPTSPSSSLPQLLAILLPLFIIGSFFSFRWETPYDEPDTLPVLEGASPQHLAPLAPATAEEERYVYQVQGVVGDYIDTLARIGPLYQQSQQDQRLLRDGAWRSELLRLFAELEQISESAKEATPPGRYAAFHDSFIRVAQRYRLAGELYEEGLTAQDEETLFLAEEAYGRANASLAELMNGDLSLMRP